ncbi:MAG TPA: metalloregulator ArsR/SmtB family transcription factor [Thermomicrobiaceae bacterium]|nr:metalloregulator ArsR/SmtB family transcription factor [Thermomicrobiaceae bacterium]
MIEVSCGTTSRAPVTENPTLPAVADGLRALGDPTRLRVFDLLMQGVQCNCELVGSLDLAPNLISHHLGVLRRAGLVTATRDPDDARWIYYAVDRAGLDRLNAVLGAFLDPARIRPRQPQCGPRGRG